MYKARVLILLLLPSACAGVGTPAPMQGGAHTIVGTMNAPVVLQAREVSTVAAPPVETRSPEARPIEAPATVAPPVEARPAEAPAPRTVRPAAPLKAGVPYSQWGAKVDYDHGIDRAYMLADVARNQDVSRPAFATLKRSFGTGEFRPYIGVGVGQASAKFGALDPGTEEGYAVKGVVGGNLFFTDEVGGYVQYDYAIAAENPALADEDESHGISLGLSISLN